MFSLLAKTTRAVVSNGSQHSTRRSPERARFTERFAPVPDGLSHPADTASSPNFLTSKLAAPKEEDLSKGILDAIDMDSYRVEKGDLPVGGYCFARSEKASDTTSSLGPAATADCAPRTGGHERK